MKWCTLKELSLKPEGLHWYEQNGGEFYRFPVSERGNPDFESIWHLTTFPSGARLRFRSNTRSLGLRVFYPGEPPQASNMSRVALRGIQIDVNGVFWNVPTPSQDGQFEVTPFLSDSSEEREFCLHLPVYSGCRVEALGLDEGAEISSPSSYPPGLPLVFYGSSITHGACASRPGLTLPARVAAAMKRDFYNLGMSNVAPVGIARLMAEISASCYVLELGVNFYSSPNSFTETCHIFLDEIRSKRPDTPVLMISPPVNGRGLGLLKRGINLSANMDIIREAVQKEYKRRKSAGERATYFVSGLSLLSSNELDGLTDDLHPNDEGFALMTKRLLPVVESILSDAVKGTDNREIKPFPARHAKTNFNLTVGKYGSV